MAPLHTAILLEEHDLVGEDFSIPDDERWVIRTFTVFSSGLGSGVTYQLVDQSNHATILYGSTPTSLFSGFDVLTDLRIVLGEGRSYAMTTSSAADIGIFGFKLSLP